LLDVVPLFMDALLLFMLEETGLTLSEAECDGGVKSCPTLTDAELDCEPFRFGR
jgi:hypothetical protein